VGASDSTESSTNAKEASVEANCQQDADVFTEFVRQHQKAVFAVAYGKLGNAQDAEDVVQDVFMEAHKNEHKLIESAKSPAWLFKATVYRCTDHIRKVSRRRKREAAYVETAPAIASNDPEPEAERIEAMFAAIGALPEKYRILILMKHFARLSYADISRMTGLSKTTIDGRLRTAKKRLRRQITEADVGVS
jgi:RNA polymerase sigma-70 factor (ECF subfamily)